MSLSQLEPGKITTPNFIVSVFLECENKHSHSLFFEILHINCKTDHQPLHHKRDPSFLRIIKSASNEGGSRHQREHPITNTMADDDKRRCNGNSKIQGHLPPVFSHLQNLFIHK